MKLAQHKIVRFDLITRGSLFAIIWWMLTDGDAQSWWIGAPAVLLTAGISTVALGPSRMCWPQLFWFIPFFFKRSLVGAIDVSRRAIQPSLPLTPALVEHPLQIPKGDARTLLVNIISLLPGTLSADVRGDCLVVHVLDGKTDFRAELAEVEQAVARLYKVQFKGVDSEPAK